MQQLSEIMKALQRNGWEILKRDIGVLNFIAFKDGIGVGVDTGLLRHTKADLALFIDRHLALGYLEKKGDFIRGADIETWVSVFGFIHSFLSVVREIRKTCNIPLTPLLVTPIAFCVDKGDRLASARFYLNKFASFSVNLAVRNGITELAIGCDGYERRVATLPDLLSQINKITALLQI